jgi:hypothetical protein
MGVASGPSTGVAQAQLPDVSITAATDTKKTGSRMNAATTLFSVRRSAARINVPPNHLMTSYLAYVVFTNLVL